jgi:hypothetical protein
MFSVLSDIAGSIFALLGLLVFVLVFVRGMQAPADESNRIAHLILVWEALKSPHRFVGLKRFGGEEAFPYLSQDIGDTVRGK